MAKGPWLRALKPPMNSPCGSETAIKAPLRHNSLYFGDKQLKLGIEAYINSLKIV